MLFQKRIERSLKLQTGLVLDFLAVGRKLLKLTWEGLKKKEEQNNRFTIDESSLQVESMTEVLQIVL